MINYTHKGINFQCGCGLNIYLGNNLLPLKIQLNNNSPSWSLDRKNWLMSF